MGFKIAPIMGIATILRLWKKSYKINLPSPFNKKSAFGFKSLKVNGLQMGSEYQILFVPLIFDVVS